MEPDSSRKDVGTAINWNLFTVVRGM